MVTRDWARLGRKVRNRRVRLGYMRQADLAEAGGPKERAISSLETGNPIKEWQFDKLEIVLRWAPGSCEAILAGGEAVELDVPANDPSATRGDALQGLTPLERELVLASHAEIARRMTNLVQDRGQDEGEAWLEYVLDLRERHRPRPEEVEADVTDTDRSA